MKLTNEQLKDLEARCDAALKRKTFKGQMRAMGEAMNADIPALPRPLRAKFRRVLKAIAWTTFAGSVPDRRRHH